MEDPVSVHFEVIEHVGEQGDFSTFFPAFGLIGREVGVESGLTSSSIFIEDDVDGDDDIGAVTSIGGPFIESWEDAGWHEELWDLF